MSTPPEPFPSTFAVVKAEPPCTDRSKFEDLARSLQNVSTEPRAPLNQLHSTPPVVNLACASGSSLLNLPNAPSVSTPTKALLDLVSSTDSSTTNNIYQRLGNILRQGARLQQVRAAAASPSVKQEQPTSSEAPIPAQSSVKSPAKANEANPKKRRREDFESTEPRDKVIIKTEAPRALSDVFPDTQPPPPKRPKRLSALRNPFLNTSSDEIHGEGDELDDGAPPVINKDVAAVFEMEGDDDDWSEQGSECPEDWEISDENSANDSLDISMKSWKGHTDYLKAAKRRKEKHLGPSEASVMHPNQEQASFDRTTVDPSSLSPPESTASHTADAGLQLKETLTQNDGISVPLIPQPQVSNHSMDSSSSQRRKSGQVASSENVDGSILIEDDMNSIIPVLSSSILECSCGSAPHVSLPPTLAVVGEMNAQLATRSSAWSHLQKHVFDGAYMNNIISSQCCKIHSTLSRVALYPVQFLRRCGFSAHRLVEWRDHVDYLLLCRRNLSQLLLHHLCVAKGEKSPRHRALEELLSILPDVDGDVSLEDQFFATVKSLCGLEKYHAAGEVMKLWEAELEWRWKHPYRCNHCGGFFDVALLCVMCGLKAEHSPPMDKRTLRGKVIERVGFEVVAKLFTLM